MPKTDLMLLHPPSVYDFREEAMMLGPVSDVVPSTQVFEMYPIGFLTMMTHLERHGYSVRVINVALRMLRNRRFDVERLVESLEPGAFGIDLHWLVHAQGSLELARIVKKYHPETPIIFGGLSSSYYHEELITYPQVDYVLRGDSTEDPLRQLLQAIREGRPPDGVPNLTWRRNGQAVVNDLTHVPRDLNDLSFDYGRMVRSSARHLDVLGHLPFLSWLKYPIVPGLSCRGCTHNCVTCGGSASAFQTICGRNYPAFRDPELLAHDISVVSRWIKAPAMVLGDLLQGGRNHAERFLDALERERVTNHIALEFFSPPPKDLVQKVARTIPRFDFQISPESHDEDIRKAFGKPYSNRCLEAFIQDALELGCHRMDLFFMVGLPHQTPQSVRDTLSYCQALWDQFSRYGDGRFNVFISPLAPFLAPGSPAFEQPEEHGYRLFHRTLEEHRQALLSPSWKYTLNYETTWMNRDQIVDAVYEAASGLNGLKVRYGLVSHRSGQALESRIRQEWEITRALDDVAQCSDMSRRERMTREVMSRFQSLGQATICGQDEMKWPTRLMRFRPLRIIREAWRKS